MAVPAHKERLQAGGKEEKVTFAKLDPFNIACFDRDAGIIVDNVFMDAEWLPGLVAHEREHMESEGMLDFRIEVRGVFFALSHFADISRKKPLWVFSSFFPLIGYKTKKWTWGVDWLRAFILSFLLFELLYVFFFV